MRFPVAIIVTVSLTSLAFADSEFDGLWKRAPIVLSDGTIVDPYECSGRNGEGTIIIEGNTYRDTESDCTMSNSQNVRGMDARLFDVTCRGEWGSLTQRELMMLYRDLNDRERLLMVRPNGSAEFERCN